MPDAVNAIPSPQRARPGNTLGCDIARQSGKVRTDLTRNVCPTTRARRQVITQARSIYQHLVLKHARLAIEALHSFLNMSSSPLWFFASFFSSHVRAARRSAVRRSPSESQELWSSQLQPSHNLSLPKRRLCFQQTKRIRPDRASKCSPSPRFRTPVALRRDGKTLPSLPSAIHSLKSVSLL